MPKRKTKRPETIEELIDELDTANETITEEVENVDNDSTKDKPQVDDMEVDKKRGTILKLAEDGEIDKSVSYIKKASQKIIDKLYTEHERKRMQKANEYLTDLLISKFSSTLGGLDAIESPDVLSDELKKDKMLKRDVYSLVEAISPYLPFLGILSGGVTTAKHIYNYESKTDSEPTE